MSSVNSFLLRMPAGIPGDVNRVAAATIEAQNVTPTGTTGAPTTFGVPLVVDNTGGNVGNMRVVTTTDTAIYGMLVREYPTNSSQDALNKSTPPTSGPISVMVRGYMSVVVGGSTAVAKGDPLNLWVAATSGAHIQGQFEPAAGGGSNTIVVPGYFMGPADSGGIVEIAFNI